MDPTSAVPAADAPAALPAVPLRPDYQVPAPDLNAALDQAANNLRSQFQPTQAAAASPAPMDIKSAGASLKAEMEGERDLTAGALQFRAAHQDLDPAKAGEILRYSMASGMKPEDVEAALPEVKKVVDAQQTDWGDLVRRYPALAHVALDRHAGAVLQDDLANAGTLEWGVTMPLHVLMDQVRQQETIARQAAEYAGAGSEQNRARINELEQSLGEKDYGANSILAKAWLGPAKLAVPVIGDLLARWLGGTIGGALAGAGGAGAGAAAGAPAAGAGALPGAAIGAAGGAASGVFWGQFLGSGLFNTYETIGPLYWDLVQQGVDPGTARAVAAGGAGLTGLLSAGFLGKVGAAIPGVRGLLADVGATTARRMIADDTLRSSLTTAVKESGKHWATGSLLLGGLAGISAGTLEAGKAFSGQESNWGNVAQAIVKGTLTGAQDMLLMSGWGPMHDLVHDLGRSKASAEGTARAQVLADAAAASKVLEHSPETFERLLQRSKAQPGALQDVLIPVEDFNRYCQGAKVDPGQLAADVAGDGGKGYAEALATKGDVSFPVEKFYSKLGKTEHAAGLVQDIHFQPDEPTGRQRAARETEINQRLLRLADVEPDLMEASQRKVYDDYFDKARGAGEHEEVADANARAVAAAFTAWAEDHSKQHPDAPITAEDLYRQKALVNIIGPNGKANAAVLASSPPVDTSARPNEPASLNHIRQQWAEWGKTPGKQAQAYHTDANTGLYNVEGFKTLAPPAGRPYLARFQREAVKLRNDAHFHSAVEGDLRGMAAALETHGIKDGGRDGTEVMAWVRDAQEAKDIAAEMAKESPGLQVTTGGAEHPTGGDVGATIKAANDKGKELRDAAVAAGELGHRKGVPKAYEDPTLKVNWDTDKTLEEYTPEELAQKGVHPKSPEAKALLAKAAAAIAPYSDSQKARPERPRLAITPEHQAAFDKLAPAKAFDTLYRWSEDKGGLLTGPGMEEAEKLKGHANPFQTSVDMRGVGDMRKVFGETGTDAVTQTFSKIIANLGGNEFDAARPHTLGDEFWSHGKDEQSQTYFWNQVREASEDLVVSQPDAAGTTITYMKGVSFAHGIGTDFDAAERNLTERKSKQSAPSAPVTVATEEFARLFPRGQHQRLELPSRPAAARAGSHDSGPGSGQAPAAVERGASGVEPGPGLRTAAPAAGGGAQGKVVGHPTEIYTPQLGSEPAHYELVEADSLIASHNANTFQPNEAYPAGVQERQYHSQPEERNKVARGAQSLKPLMVLANTPTPVDGPPIVTSGARRLVLGGNGRTMMMQRGFADESTRDTYRKALAKQAESFGVDPEQVAKMKAPVLVRVADSVSSEAPKEQLQAAVRRYNEPMMQQLSPIARAAAEAAALKPATVTALSETLGEGTLRDAMRDQPEALVSILRRDGVITDQNQAAWIAGGRLTEDGKNRLEGMFLGRALGSGDLIAATAPALLAKVERVVTPLLKVAGANPALDETATLQAAVRLLNDAKLRGMSLKDLLAQGSMFETSTPASDAVQSMAALLEGAGQKAVGERFARWAQHAAVDPRQRTMFDSGATSESARKLLFEGYPPARSNPLPEGGAFRLQAKSGSIERGALTFLPTDGSGKPRSFTIELLKGADRSTLAHETAHFLGEVMGDLASAPGASDALKADYKVLLDWMGHGTHEERLRAGVERRSLAKLTQRTSEQDARLQELTGREERLAHGWEQYLFEGKTPSPELATVFARFRNWIGTAYKTIVGGPGGQFKTDYGQELGLTPDVRRVFDRLLAGDTASKVAADRMGRDRASTELRSRMTDAEWEDYQKVRSQADAEANDELQRRLLEADRKENASWARQLREEYSTEANDRLDKDPAYRSIKYLKTGQMVGGPDVQAGAKLLERDGKPLKLDRADFEKRYPGMAADLEEEHGKGIFATKKEGGADAETAASLLGFENADAMKDALAGAPRRKKVVDEEVRKRMAETFGPTLIDDHERLVDEALTSAHNEKQLEAVLRERRALVKDLSPQEKAQAPAIDVKAVQAHAKRILEGKLVRDIRPERYLTAERTAARQAIELAGKKGAAAAVALKDSQLLNMALYRAARDLKTELQTKFNLVSQSSGDAWRSVLGQANPIYRDAHDAILDAMKMGKGDFAGAAGAQAFEALMTRADGLDQRAGWDANATRSLLVNPGAWGTLVVDDAREAYNAIRGIKHWANDENKVKVGGRLRELGDAVDSCIHAAETNLPEAPKRHRDKMALGPLDKVSSWLRSADGYLLTMDRVVDFLDGGPTGPFHDTIIKPWREAIGVKDRLLRTVVKDFQERWNTMPEELRALRDTKVDLSKDLPTSSRLAEKPVTHAELWMIALNMGNADNLQRLTDGYHWNEEQVRDTLAKHMTAPEWHWVQGVWDSLEQLWPDIAAQHEKDTGLPLKKVERTPFEARCADGTTAQLEGGYLPLVYDKDIEQVGEKQEWSSLKDLAAPPWIRSATSRSHTKKRVEHFEGALNLDWNVVPNHVAQVCHDLAFRDYVRQTGQVFLDDRFKAALSASIGAERARYFPSFLQSVARAQGDSVPEHLGPLMAAVGWMRGRVALQSLGYSIGAAASYLPTPAVAWAAGDVKAIPMASAVARFMAHPSESRRFALENSPELKHRSENMLAQLRLELGKMGGRKTNPILEAVQHTAFAFMEAVDKVTATPLWMGRYNQEISAGTSHEQAVELADRVVRNQFPAVDPAEGAPILRDRGAIGSMMMFYGYSNKLYNGMRGLLHEPWLAWHDDEKGIGSKLSATAVFAGRMLAMSTALAGADLLAGRGKEDDEDWAEWLSRKVLLGPVNTVPLVGQGIEALALHKKVSLRQSPSLAGLQTSLETAGRLGDLVRGKGDAEPRAIWGALDLLGLGVGIPTSQARKTVAYGLGLATGAQRPQLSPAGAAEVAGGFAYGHRDKQPANPFTAVADALK